MDLAPKDKPVIVAAGSKGIGRSITEAFFKEGARVAICVREEITSLQR
jgi:NAD(P)-dependent dehydrogenase (short-subunit alcohol dehydrogenase family)